MIDDILFAPGFMQRLAGSLLHFFWQGALIAMLTAVVLRLLARRSAESRYAVSVAGLVLMAAAPFATFVFYRSTGRAAEQALELLSQAAFEAGRSAESAGPAFWARWIVLAWFVGVGACLTRLAFAWRFSRKLVHSATESVPPAVMQMFERIVGQLNIRKRTRLLLSVHIPIPAVIGWLRPAVLLPVRAIASLDEEQLRAVLAHELAHIRRHDFLINTLQRCVESMLFYHPAVWWLSARTRGERENCCDDLAIQTCGDALSYAEALIALERSCASSDPALVLGATGGPLTQRVLRILGRKTTNLDWQSAAAAFVFVLACIATGIWQSSTLRAAAPPAAVRTAVEAAAVSPSSLATSLATPKAPQESPSSVLNSIAAILTAQPGAAAEPQGRDQNGVIQGIVTREGTNEPIPDVEINVMSAGRPPTGGPAAPPPPNAPPVSNGKEARDALLAGAPFVVDGNGTRYFLIGGEVYGLRNQQDAQIYLDLASRSTIAPEALQILRAAAGRNPQTGEPNPEPATFSAVSDSNGRFTIRDVPVGGAIVRAQLQGFFSPEDKGGSTMVIARTMVEPGRPSDVQLSLVPGGTISGRVFDAKGKAAADTPVQVLRAVYANGIQTLQTVSQKSTDDRGEYRIYRLPPGEYYLAALPSLLVSGGRGAPDNNREMPVRTLYPGATNLSAANSIKLRGGDDLKGLDIPIKNVVRAKISGSIVNALTPAPPVVAATNGCGVAAGTARLPIANLRILPHAVNGLLDISGDAAIQSDPDGKFAFQNVLPGEYDVFASLPSARGWGGENPPAFASCGLAFGRTTVDVRGDDVNNVTVVIHEGADIKGRTLVDEAPAAANLRVMLQLDDSASRLTSVFANVYRQIGLFQPAIQSDGTFLIPVVPHGRYRFQVSLGVAPAPQTAQGGRNSPGARLPQSGLTPLPATAYVADIRQGGVSVYDHGMTIDSASADPVDVMIGTNPGNIEGTVTGSDQKPVPDATVVLVPAESRRENPALYRTVRTDAQGRFNVTILPPGSYKLFSWETFRSGAYLSADFMKLYETRGASVAVTAGVRSTVDVKLIHD